VCERERGRESERERERAREQERERESGIEGQRERERERESACVYTPERVHACREGGTYSLLPARDAKEPLAPRDSGG